MSELLPMYAAKVNSPVTELAANISEADTDIMLVDASVLPDAPNLAVIGSDETAETVRYNGKTGNKITEVERGFQGAAKSWSKGTEVARNFTAYDADAIRENIGGLASRLDTADTSQLTLQPGLQVVSAAKDARFKLGSIKGKSEINGSGRIGIVGVENPYVIRYGANLLPPFYEWTLTNATFLDDAYQIRASTNGTETNLAEYWLPVISGATYSFSRTLQNGSVQLFGFDAINGNPVKNMNQDATNGFYTVSFTIPSTVKALRIRCYTGTDSTDSVFSDLMLTLGSKAKPFKPREDSMLAFQTDLHANPDTGADPDELFVSNGQYFKLEKWKKVVLDGYLNWAINANKPGFKQVRYPVSDGVTADSTNTKVTKYDGTVLQVADSNSIVDKYQLLPGNGYFYISVSNTDTGWGDAYTPTADEIKAYFMGWRMMNADNWTAPYNGTGTKGWYKFDKNGALVSGSGTRTLPTTINEETGQYNLLYRLAKETVEPVVSEGCLTLSEGDNVVEVGTGIVLRERANPVLSGGSYHINNTAVAGTNLLNKSNELLSVYKSDKKSSSWVLRTNQANGYGGGNAYVDQANYDQSAAYSVTYLKLDKSPIVPITGTVAVNEKAQLSDLTAGVAEALHGVSVNGVQLSSHTTAKVQSAEVHGLRVQADKLQYQLANGDWQEISGGGIQSTTEDITYWVNPVSGNDANNGLSRDTAFKTFNKALSLIPQCINHRVQINPANEDYNEDVKIEGYFGRGWLRIVGSPSTTLNAKFNRVSLKNCSLNVFIQGVTTKDQNNFRIENCINADFWYCVPFSAGDGFYSISSGVFINSSLINGCEVGIRATKNSSVISNYNTGSGNTVVYRSESSTIMKTPSNPSGSTAEQTSVGGVIR